MRRGPRQQGFTLIELLVTITIATLLIAISLPLVKYSIEEGRTREASRQFNAFLARAKAQAAYDGRPIGVMVMRDPNDTTGATATQCFLAEIPPPFGGAVLNAQVSINGGTGGLTFDGTSAAMINNLFSQSAGFGIRFDYKGPVYTGYATVTSGSASLSLTSVPMGLDLTHGYPYQLYRLPQKISNVSLELPKGTFISLANSGAGSSGTEFAAAASDKVTVMFAPSGAVSSVDYTGTSVIPSGTIHFLVCRLRNETVQPPILNDSSNYWISIGHLTGTVATTEVGFDASGDGTVTVAESRYYAMRYDQSGGR